MIYSFNEAAQKIGYRSFRKLFSICKELGIIDHERWPLAPYKHQGLFELKEVETKNGFAVNQTFVTEKGLVFLAGVIVGTRKTPEAIRRRDYKSDNQTGATKSPVKSAGTSA